jgi:hypothetical protein
LLPIFDIFCLAAILFDCLVPSSKVSVFLSIPVSSQRGNLAYRLSIKTTLYQQNPNHPGSLTGFLVVIAEDGRVLAHPLPERIGTNIKDYTDVDRIQAIVKNALSGSNNSSNL